MKAGEKEAFSGWKVVAGCFVMLFFSGGIGLFGFSVFVIPLEKHFGWSRTVIAGAAGLSAVLFGIGGPVAAWGVQRFGARKTMCASAGLLGVAYIISATQQNLAMLYGAFALSGLAIAGCGPVPAYAVICRWFVRKRGQAMGVAELGLGFGGFLAPGCINFIIERWGWRVAFASGVPFMWLVVIPAIIWLIRTTPGELQQTPDGLPPADPVAKQSAASETAGATVREALATSAFWLLFGVQMMFLFGASGVSMHFVPMLDALGAGSQWAANFWGLTVGFSMVGRVAGGWLSDLYTPRRLLMWSGVWLTTSILVLEFLVLRQQLTSAPVLVLFALFYGIGMGTLVVALPMLVASRFGMAHFGPILGLVMAGFAPGAVLGPVVISLLFDSTQQYEPGVLCVLGSFSFLTLFCFLLRPAAVPTPMLAGEVA